MVKKIWCVYLLECKNNSVYTGITNDLNTRMLKHQTGKGSKYVKSNGFKKLLGSISALNKSNASKLEYEIKQLPRTEKLKKFNLI
ncbi:hypothetical protein COU54_03345 [Candidatus Pacearchaeota archaeon CG10_big_fil_rev_8_21_14_0_10_31_24]|nr:MAG: hypothetical protein COU54_03345 [Candidatus Pacearchaeota archaeon CG10_big_fil_rev_8_21_14_0_10_31_24]